MTRLGCSWLAPLAPSMDSSSMASLSGAMISVSTRPIVTAPIFWRSSSSFLLTAVVVVSGKSTIICAAPPHRFALHRRRRGSWPPPFPAGTAQHLERRIRAPRARLVRVGLAVRRPVVQGGIEYLPSQFDLRIDGEQGRFAEQHV